MELVRQAGIRQQYIDQSVSLNLAVESTVDFSELNKVHYEAWKQGVKTLYYLRNMSPLKGDVAKSTYTSETTINKIPDGTPYIVGESGGPVCEACDG